MSELSVSTLKKYTANILCGALLQKELHQQTRKELIRNRSATDSFLLATAHAVATEEPSGVDSKENGALKKHSLSDTISFN